MATEVFPDDDHYYWLTLVVTVGMQLTCFAIAATFKTDVITDFSGGMNFVLLAVLSLLLGGAYHTRQIVLTLAVVVSRVELALFLFYRVLKRKRDARFDEMRENCVRFLGFWIFQILWVYIVSMPLVFANSVDESPDLDARDVVAWLLIAVGLIFQWVGDAQKFRFRANPDNRGKVCDVGLWSISRHPNYFGEILFWWGIFAGASPLFFTAEAAGWASIAGPIFTMLILFFLSGLPTAEGAALARFYKTPEATLRYERYRERTPIMVPFIPALFAKFPEGLKAALCCEWGIYKYTPSHDALTGAEAGKTGSYRAPV